ncbi:hypothetical protein E1265_05690 [Streptomyces sp. 8K308]|uniref:hypothetical protein n=1 Tax=Streptomyces sp. 8K308 TaxID=2530388 RepID=UPI0010535663|nr:hypothetical protein [Streptomyces sp. 8K308]TDC25988.1 hypothetical protein E1265_05690 [Streptomyces sp. 8K308]
MGRGRGAAGLVTLFPLAGAAQAAEVPVRWPSEVAGGFDGECVGPNGERPAIGWEVLDAPEVLVPGEWAEFSFHATNEGAEPLTDLLIYADLWRAEYPDHTPPEDRWGYSFQWRAPGGWSEVPFESDGWAGHFAGVDTLAPGDWVEPRVRVRLDEEAHGSMVGSLSAMTVTSEGLCSRSQESATITHAVAEPGPEPEPEPEPEPTDPEPTEPEPTPTDPGPGPTEPTSPPPSPSTPDDRRPQLAETGGGGVLPTVGALGALALASGAGVLIARQRGRAATD